MRKRVIAAWAVALAGLAFADRAEARSDDPVAVDFELSDSNTMANFLFGECVDDENDEGEGEGQDRCDDDRPLVILVHGASDTHTVFDFAPGFSVAQHLAGCGYSVLALDRVGYGASSHPNGDSLNVTVQAAELQDVIQEVRAGALGFTPPKVVTLGSSLGADIVIVEAGTYHDVDGVVVAFHTSQLQLAVRGSLRGPTSTSGSSSEPSSSMPSRGRRIGSSTRTTPPARWSRARKSPRP